MCRIGRYVATAAGLLLIFMAIANVAATQEAAPPTPTSASTEVQVLEAQLEEMKRSEDRILNTVYWSLGGLAGVAVLLVGFNAFTGWKTYQRDRENMANDLKSTIAIETSSAKSTLQSVISEQLSEIQSNQKMYETRLIGLLGEQEIRSGDRLRSTVDSTTGPIQALVSDLEKRISGVNDLLRSGLRDAKRELSSEVRSIKFDIAELEFQIAEQKDSPGRQLIAVREMLSLALDIGREWQIGNVLGYLIDTLGRVSSVNAIEATELTGLLDKTPSECSVLTTRAYAALQEAQGRQG